MKNITTFNDKQLASALIQAIQALISLPTDRLNELVAAAVHNHFHDGSQSPIAWNNVQAIRYYNEYCMIGEGKLVVPNAATEGYNKHYHTSEYDGGMIPTIGIHDHRDNGHGGFSFACFAPSTAIPQLPWES